MLVKITDSSAKFDIQVFEKGRYQESAYLFISDQRPIFSGNKTFEVSQPIESLRSIENELSGFFLDSSREEVILFSAKVSRSRLYYTVNQQGLWISDDLRKLLPFSKRKLSISSIYGILKFGDFPEHYTPIQDIFSVPVGSLLALNYTNFRSMV